ncbi:type II toxin-antitoxin system HicB family antitoxin [Alicyclobacillus sp. TC]|uniref:Antitoxin HicB n=1 Tax=Alicyclobacillus tolerans TaxID=90970 RepID=A0ABT9LZY0_9BACL|nr:MULTISPECIES: type II toxin-antitoxin system HicB family antitoxin [Alicyclobacillus]MDP9729815.1 antitoxin HicB [Alicyclobacillus tengchongensis]QRF23525.1 type II toxin-antitoxin system HicB family antitoxin [Alicyclobacillus sp. TC]
MEKNLDYYLSLPYSLVIIPDPISGGYVAKINELPGCITQGETVEEVVHGIQDAKRGWIETALEEGQTIPEPNVQLEEYSGKFVVRIPKSLHRTLVEQAKQEGVSLNQYVTYRLASGQDHDRITAHF